MNVNFVDLKEQYLKIKPEVLLEINEVLDNTAYISGKKVKEFEEGFCKIQDISYCTAVSSGTDALHAAMKIAGIKTGDEVIVPVNTFIATSAAVTLCGAQPVFVDHDEKTYNIDPTKIEKAITSKTKAILPVHLYGQPAEINPIIEIAKKNNLIVIEDCSQAHLAEYRGKKVGGFGIMGTFSYYPGKNLGAYGEGGSIVTNVNVLHEQLIKFRQHGSTVKYIHEFEGTNYRMEEIQAGVLKVKLKYINEWTEKRRQAAKLYNELLGKLSKDYMTIPYNPEYVKHVYHLYIIRAKNRDKLIKHLSDKGIQTALHYPIPLHLQKAYKYLNYSKGDFPVAEKCCKEILSLPMYPELKKNHIEYVCEMIKDFYS